jgi:hypothetical protein
VRWDHRRIGTTPRASTCRTLIKPPLAPKPSIRILRTDHSRSPAVRFQSTPETKRRVSGRRRLIGGRGGACCGCRPATGHGQLVDGGRELEYPLGEVQQLLVLLSSSWTDFHSSEAITWRFSSARFWLIITKVERKIASRETTRVSVGHVSSPGASSKSQRAQCASTRSSSSLNTR